MSEEIKLGDDETPRQKLFREIKKISGLQNSPYDGNYELWVNRGTKVSHLAFSGSMGGGILVVIEAIEHIKRQVVCDLDSRIANLKAIYSRAAGEEKG